jgi:hypothetical protein
METILLILVIGLINALCFFIGAKIGQKVVRGETIETPLKSPLEVVREAKSNFEYRKEQERLQTIADNIDNYDGTGIGQKDIPNI